MKETVEQYLERVIGNMVENEGFEMVSQTSRSTVYYSENKGSFAVYEYGKDIWEGTHSDLVKLVMEI